MPSASQVGTYNVKIIASANNVWHPDNDFYFTKEDDFVFTIINGCTTATFIDKTVDNMIVKMGDSQTLTINFDSAYQFKTACGAATLS
jgi:hypothetical protein